MMYLYSNLTRTYSIHCTRDDCNAKKDVTTNPTEWMDSHIKDKNNTHNEFLIHVYDDAAPS